MLKSSHFFVVTNMYHSNTSLRRSRGEIARQRVRRNGVKSDRYVPEDFCEIPLDNFLKTFKRDIRNTLLEYIRHTLFIA